MKEVETLLLEQHYPERIIKAGINTDLKIPQNKLRNIEEQVKRKSYFLFQILIQTISNFALNKPRKTSDRIRNA